jgi:hypothetical protein
MVEVMTAALEAFALRVGQGWRRFGQRVGIETR